MAKNNYRFHADRNLSKWKVDFDESYACRNKGWIYARNSYLIVVVFTKINLSSLTSRIRCDNPKVLQSIVIRPLWHTISALIPLPLTLTFHQSSFPIDSMIFRQFRLIQINSTEGVFSLFFLDGCINIISTFNISTVVIGLHTLWLLPDAVCRLFTNKRR